MAMDDTMFSALADTLRRGIAIPTSLRDTVALHFGEKVAASAKYDDDTVAGSATARAMIDPAAADALRARKASVAQQAQNTMIADAFGATPAPNYESAIDTPAPRSRGLLFSATTPWRTK